MPSFQGLNAVALNEELHEAYCRIVTSSALAPLLELPGRSGVFLPQASLEYCQSFGRILVVGRAPKGWLNKLDLSTTPTAEYVRRSTTAHLGVLLAKPGKHKFLQFLKRANQRMGGVAGTVGWCNLFATRQLCKGVTNDDCQELPRGVPSHQAPIQRATGRPAADPSTARRLLCDEPILRQAAQELFRRANRSCRRGE